MKLNIFILTYKKLTLSTLAFIISFFFRNLFARWFGVDNSVPTYIAYAIIVYVIICVIYTRIKKGKMVLE